jgi:uncharacterized MAPEG superfamily protein
MNGSVVVGRHAPSEAPSTRVDREGRAMRMHSRQVIEGRFGVAGEAVESRLIFALTFPVFLAAVLVSRLASAGRGPRVGSRRSILAEARAAANTCIPFAFMG